jgi:hypothetical protein
VDESLLKLLVDLGRLLHSMSEATSVRAEQMISLQPLLLDYTTLEDLSGNAARLRGSEREAAADLALRSLHSIRQRCLADPLNYPLNGGPLERLWERVWTGEITLEYAERCAAADVPGVLTDVYALAVSAFALQISRGGDWRRAFEVERLLLAAARTFRWQGPGKHPREATARWVAEREWIEVAHSILTWLPHRAVYHDAVEAGEQLLSENPLDIGDADRGLVLLRLGTLHLGPYTVDKSSGDYDLGLRIWNQRLADELGPGEVARLEDLYQPLPSPRQALARSADYLRSAMPLLSGPDKGLCAKALLQALHWSGLLGDAKSSEEILAAGHEALGLLPGPGFAHLRAAVVAMLADHGAVVGEDTIRDLLAQSFDEVVHQTGPAEALDLLQQVMDVLWRVAPGRALDVARDGRDLVQVYATDERRQNHLVEEVRLLAEVHAAEGLPGAASGDLGQRAQIIRERALQEEWDARTLSASLLSLASASPDTDEETEGLSLLEEAVHVAPLFAQGFAAAIEFLATELTYDRAAVAEQRHHHAEAAEAYALAASSYCDMGLPEAVQDCLARLQHVAASGDPAIPGYVLAGLEHPALPIERMLGEQAARRLQAIYREAVAALPTSGADMARADVLLGLMQLANGWRFAASIGVGPVLAGQDDEDGTVLLEEIRIAELAVGESADNDRQAYGLLDEETLLGQYIRPDPDRLGQTAAERLANLRHSYDAHLNDRLLSAESGYPLRLASVGDVQRVLDGQTVLVSFLPGTEAGTAVQLHGVAVTDSEVVTFSGSCPVPADGDDAEAGPDEGRVGGLNQQRRSTGDTAHRDSGVTGVGTRVASVRRAVQDEPGARRVSRRAENLLREDCAGLFGDLAVRLNIWREQGRKYLIFVPHGPMQYYPVHLLLRGERPLAADWVVTYLPSLSLLFRSADRSPVGARLGQRMTAIGIGFAGTASALPGATEESKAIADAVRGRTLPDTEVTPEKLMTALRTSRCIHLATHGRHDVTAPAFQSIQTSDGPLYAHQITSLDLLGLSLLTLSACETGLGRVDSAANTRGLPAAFLQAGAATLVVTMWRVETATSRTFFTDFYANLAAGGSRRDAFFTAQSSTRQEHPDFRDWGAFALLGDWT